MLSSYISIGFTDSDMSRSFLLPSHTHIGGDRKTLSLSEIETRLRQVYCHHIGLEYMHISDRSKRTLSSYEVLHQ